jgi:hypothetical protein
MATKKRKSSGSKKTTSAKAIRSNPVSSEANIPPAGAVEPTVPETAPVVAPVAAVVEPLPTSAAPAETETPVVEPAAVVTAPTPPPVVKTSERPKAQGSVKVTPSSQLDKLMYDRGLLFQNGGAINNAKKLQANMLEIYRLAHSGDATVLRRVVEYLQTKRWLNTGVGTLLVTSGLPAPLLNSMNIMIVMLNRIADKRRLKTADIVPNESMLGEIVVPQVYNFIMQNLK